MMTSLFHNLRFYILASAVVLSAAIYVWVSQTVQGSILQITREQELYSFVSLILLYFTLLAGPFCYTFKKSLPKKFCNDYIFSRRALGVAAFYFAFLHFYLTFFDQLEGFNGLGFFDTKYLTALGLGFLALVIMLLLAITSFERVITWMSFPKWKLLHRLVYIAGILILIHVVMLGSHYSDLSGGVSQVTFLALAFLLILEAPRFDKLFARFITIPRVSLSSALFALILGVLYFTIISPLFPSASGGVSFDVHAAHKALAQQALQNQGQQTINGVDVSKIPGLDGDRNKRYTVSFLHPDDVQPNEDTQLQFNINDAANGFPVDLFKIVYGQPMHMIVVDSSLQYFSHVHPVQNSDGFTITTQFPKPDLYHIYLEFQPFGGIEQQMAFTLPVGGVDVGQAQKATTPVDKKLTKVFGDYQVTLNTNGPLDAAAMSAGNDKLTFTIVDAKTKKPVTNLEPYLASFGHLTMINEDTYDFLHVHPYSVTIPPPNAKSGPTVDFLPIGIYGPFKPGIYRAFAEFNPGGNLITTDFTVKVN